MPANPTYEPLATTTLGTATSTITFSSVPSTYTDIKVVVVVPNTASSLTVYLQFNSDTSGAGSNYSRTSIQADGSTTSSSRGDNIAYISIGSAATQQPTFFTADIFSYAGSTFKTVLGVNARDLNGSGDIVNFVGMWRSTAAISTILVKSTSNMPIGTTATLYGITKA